VTGRDRYRVLLVDAAGRQFRGLSPVAQETVRAVVQTLAGAAAASPPNGELMVEEAGAYQIFYVVDHQNGWLVVREIVSARPRS
jgi:hypothetical protein